MAPKLLTISQTGQHVEYVKGPQFSSSYCNNIAYATSSLDFVLIFGEILNMTTETVTIEQRARITMAPAQAKTLHAILEEQIDLYEKRSNTKIELPAPVPRSETKTGAADRVDTQHEDRRADGQD